MPSLCHPHPDKMAHRAILYGRLYGRDIPDIDTDDKKSPNVI